MIGEKYMYGYGENIENYKFTFVWCKQRIIKILSGKSGSAHTRK